MNLNLRIEKLENLLLPRPDYQDDLYDFLIQAEIATVACTEAEAVERYGDKKTWLNDRRPG